MIKFITLATLLYAGLVGCAFIFQRSLLYFPDSSTPSRRSSGLEHMAVVTLHTSDGLELLAWYRKAETGHPTLVLFHGNAGHIGHRSHKIRPFLDAGMGVLLAEYRGYGGNDGKPSEAGLYRDGRAALQFLADDGVREEKIVLCL